MGHASQRMICDRKGQSLVEYAMILFLVALAVVATLGAFGTTLVGLYTSIVSLWPAV